MPSPNVGPYFDYDKNGRLIAGSFRHEELGRDMIALSHATLLNGQLIVWSKSLGRYVSRQEEVDRVMLEEYCAFLNVHQRKEVREYLACMCEESAEADPNFVVFQNGTVDIAAFNAGSPDFFGPNSPAIVTATCIPHRFVPGAQSDVLEKTLDRISSGDPKTRAAIEEVFGTAIYRSNAFQKTIWFVGVDGESDASNGKSTLIEVMIAIAGKYAKKIKFGKLGQRFTPGQLIGKLLAIDSDVSTGFVEGDALSAWKEMCAGETVAGELKNVRYEIDFRNGATFIFASNVLPPLPYEDASKPDSILRRIQFIGLRATIRTTDPDYDPDLWPKLREEPVVEAACVLAVKGLARLVRNKGQFTDNGFDVDARMKQQMIADNNSVARWIEEQGVGVEAFYPLDPGYVLVGGMEPYDLYREWCKRFGYKYQAMRGFNDYVGKKFKLKRSKKTYNVPGYGSQRVFLKPGDDEDSLEDLIKMSINPERFRTLSVRAEYEARLAEVAQGAGPEGGGDGLPQ